LGIGRSYFRGNVGIGTGSPAYKLDITNNANEAEKFIRIKAQDSNDYFAIQNGTGGAGIFLPYLIGAKFSDNKQALYLTGQIEAAMDDGAAPVVVFDARYATAPVQNRPLFQWSSYNQPKMVMTPSGSLGIGTTLASNPNNYKLAVNGTIGANEVIIETSSSTWPDYVFEEDYPLMPLTDLESFLKQNKHLPGIPTAEEVEEKGQSLGEMNALLLKKVEELTLYVIQLEERDNEYLDMIIELKDQVEQLKDN
jgi:hypothetical protein